MAGISAFGTEFAMTRNPRRNRCPARTTRSFKAILHLIQQCRIIVFIVVDVARRTLYLHRVYSLFAFCNVQSRDLFEQTQDAVTNTIDEHKSCTK